MGTDFSEQGGIAEFRTRSPSTADTRLISHVQYHQFQFREFASSARSESDPGVLGSQILEVCPARISERVHSARTLQLLWNRKHAKPTAASGAVGPQPGVGRGSFGEAARETRATRKTRARAGDQPRRGAGQQ